MLKLDFPPNAREVIISKLSIFDKATEREDKTWRERKWQAISSWVDATAFCYAYNSPFDTERRRRVPNVNEPFSFSVEEFVWVPISFTDDVNSERCALCGVFPSRSEDDDDDDGKEEETAEVECLINLLFIVVRSSSSDTKHQLRRVTSDVCILISYSTLFYLCHGALLSDSLQLTFRLSLRTFETTHYVRMALWRGALVYTSDQWARALFSDFDPRAWIRCSDKAALASLPCGFSDEMINTKDFSSLDRNRVVTTCNRRWKERQKT